MSMSSNAVDNVSVLASAIFKRVDTNGDGKLDGAEFQSFLENLLGKVGKGTPGLGSEAGAVAPRSATAFSTTRMTRNPLDARQATRPKSSSRSAKKSRSAEGPVGAKAADGSDPRTRATSTRIVAPEAPLTKV